MPMPDQIPVYEVSIAGTFLDLVICEFMHAHVQYGMVCIYLSLGFFIAYAYIPLSYIPAIKTQSGNKDQLTDPALAAYNMPFGKIWILSRDMELLVWAEVYYYIYSTVLE